MVSIGLNPGTFLSFNNSIMKTIIALLIIITGYSTISNEYPHHSRPSVYDQGSNIEIIDMVGMIDMTYCPGGMPITKTNMKYDSIRTTKR